MCWYKFVDYFIVIVMHNYSPQIRLDNDTVEKIDEYNEHKTMTQQNMICAVIL